MDGKESWLFELRSVKITSVYCVIVSIIGDSESLTRISIDMDAASTMSVVGCI
jgi:hypothetical protein